MTEQHVGSARNNSSFPSLLFALITELPLALKPHFLLDNPSPVAGFPHGDSSPAHSQSVLTPNQQM